MRARATSRLAQRRLVAEQRAEPRRVEIHLARPCLLDTRRVNQGHLEQRLLRRRFLRGHALATDQGARPRLRRRLGHVRQHAERARLGAGLDYQAPGARLGEDGQRAAGQRRLGAHRRRDGKARDEETADASHSRHPTSHEGWGEGGRDRTTATREPTPSSRVGRGAPAQRAAPRSTASTRAAALPARCREAWTTRRVGVSRTARWRRIQMAGPGLGAGRPAGAVGSAARSSTTQAKPPERASSSAARQA